MQCSGERLLASVEEVRYPEVGALGRHRAQVLRHRHEHRRDHAHHHHETKLRAPHSLDVLQLDLLVAAALQVWAPHLAVVALGLLSAEAEV
eukprot:COSAG06_NODE_5942_length_3197_cov_67.443835_4_plen_91_part_00